MGMWEGTIGFETSTAGTFLLQWAQNASDANNLMIQRGSSLITKKLA